MLSPNSLHSYRMQSYQMHLRKRPFSTFLIVRRRRRCRLYNLWSQKAIVHTSVHLRTLLFIQAQRALAVQAVGPKPAEGYIGVGNLCMCQEEPEAKDWLGKNVQDSISNNLLVDRQMTASVGDTPDTNSCQQRCH